MRGILMSTQTILQKYPDYEVNIGIEVHVQLTTKSKIFCTCSNQFSNEPNTNICPVCTGHPGTLPVLNKLVVDYAIKAGLATHCKIEELSEFARKHYFYPDLPKGYQISQHDKPICTHGTVAIRLEDGSKKNIRLIRIHIEEDAGKNIHSPYSNESFVDFNRAGTPLLEIVTYPDISSAYEARAYLKTLRSIVMYLDICSGNMEEGAFRADTNISVRKKGATQLGTKCELKNINSFKFISDAIEYEIERQITLLEAGGSVKQETRSWDKSKTVPLRSKEEAADYRYFPDPDLPLIEITSTMIAAAQKTMPELPDEKFERYITQNKLSPYEAEILVNDQDLANYYDAAYKHTESKLLINWILRDVMSVLKDQKITIHEFKIKPEYLASLVDLIEKGTINNQSAKEAFLLSAETGQDPRMIVKEKGLEQIGDVAELDKIIQEIVLNNPEQAAEYRSGKERLFGFFVGQAMQKTKGKANPQLINELLKKHLG